MDESLAIDTYTFSITIEILSIAMAETLLTTSTVISFQHNLHIISVKRRLGVVISAKVLKTS